MQFKVRHKLTFDLPDNITAQIPRSNRRTKTMLKSFRSMQKDINFLDPASNVCKDQKQMKTLVQCKIQELHDKMKSSFSHQRKTHLQQIAPEMQEIANSIIQLKQQLNRPKSMAQIEEEKHELLRRKVALLKQIEQTNKQVKQNKAIFYELKFETQQLERQLKNGQATIAKYKRKLQGNQSKIQDTKVIHSKGNEVSSQNDQNLQKILNQSLCQQNIPSSTTGYNSFHDTSQLTTQRQKDHVHITEVIGHDDKSFRKEIKPSKNFINNSKQQNKNNQTLTPLDQGILKQNQQLNKSNSMAVGTVKKSHDISGVLQKQLTKMSKQMSLSNSSFEEYLKCSTLLQKKVKKPDQNHKYTKSIIKNTLEMSSELRKYEEIVNKQKWKKIGSLFAQLECPHAKHCLLPKNDETQITKKQKNQLHISDLEELLMDELRKEQFQSFKEKGYHEGLKDKTHQIKIEMKRIFKNYSPDQFFESIINKKPIKKQLAMILEDSFN